MPSAAEQLPRFHIGVVTTDNKFFYNKGIGFYLHHDSHRYKRVDSRRLYSQATGFSRGKDQSLAYYQAQLMLYGLKPKRSRPEMKRVLLAAFGDKHTLEVPEWFRSEERFLENKWKWENEMACREILKRREEAKRQKTHKHAERQRAREALLAARNVDSSSGETPALGDLPRRERNMSNPSGPPLKKAKATV